MKATFIFLFLLLLFSCQNSEEKQLEKVLTLSGNNRPELEKVLEHYKENEADSLKLRAAKFLIINMPGHQSYTGKDIEEYYVEAEKIIFSDRKIVREAYQKLIDKGYLEEYTRTWIREELLCARATPEGISKNIFYGTLL